MVLADDAQKPLVPRKPLPEANVPFPLDPKVRSHLGVFGATGYGKTFWAERYIRDHHALGWECFVVDWKHDRENFTDLPRYNYGNGARAGIKINPKKAGIWVVRFNGDKKGVHNFVRVMHNLAIKNREGDGGGIPRPVLFLFDEIDTYQNEGDEIGRVFRQGRGNHVHGIAITPRPQDIEKEIWNNCTAGTVFFGFEDDIRKPLWRNYNLIFPDEYWAHIQKPWHAAFRLKGRWSAIFPERPKRSDDDGTNDGTD